MTVGDLILVFQFRLESQTAGRFTIVRRVPVILATARPQSPPKWKMTTYRSTALLYAPVMHGLEIFPY